MFRLLLTILLLNCFVSCQKFDKTKYATQSAAPRDLTTFYPYLSQNEFRQLADHIIDDTHVPFYPKRVKEGDIVFLKTKYMRRFLKYMHPRIKNPYILITHFGDEEVPGPYASLLEDKKIIKWFGLNATVSHPKLISLPIGVGAGNIIREVQDTPIEKKRLLILNFSVGTYRGRVQVKEHFSKKPFCEIQERCPFPQYLKEMKASKFVVSPRGNGIDCHRVWEALLVGTIPILKSSPLDNLYQDFPVLIVDDWEQVTEEFLEEKYKEITAKSYDMNKLYADYWLKLIDSYSPHQHYSKQELVERSSLTSKAGISL